MLAQFNGSLELMIGTAAQLWEICLTVWCPYLSFRGLSVLKDTVKDRNEMASKLLSHSAYLYSWTSVLGNILVMEARSLHSNTSLILSHGVIFGNFSFLNLVFFLLLGR